MCVPGLLSGLDWVECGCCVVLIGGSSVSSLVSGCDAVTGRTCLKGQTLYCVHVYILDSDHVQVNVGV